jgi:hypothetical protein
MLIIFYKKIDNAHMSKDKLSAMKYVCEGCVGQEIAADGKNSLTIIEYF